MYFPQRRAALFRPPPAEEAPDGDSILQENDDLLLLEAGGPVPLNTGIPAQSTASTLTGEEWVVIVQGGVTSKIRSARIAEYLNG